MVQNHPGADVQVVQVPRAAPSRESLELVNLETRRAELRGQLASTTERRQLLIDQMRQSEGPARNELAQRVRALDGRTARIDNELTEIDDRISALLARGVRSPPSGFDRLMEGAFNAPGRTPGVQGQLPSNPFESEWGILFGGMVMMQGLTLLLLAVVVWRSFVRRSFAKLAGDDANRLEQLQRSVDVMAVEVERVSESQRFTAKMLNEQSAEPVRVAKDTERVRN